MFGLYKKSFLKPLLVIASLVATSALPIFAQTANAAVPTQLIFTLGPTSSTVAGVVLSEIDVSVEDSTGTVVSSSTASISLSATGLVGCSSAVAISGVAKFTGCSLTVAGTQSITASDAADSLTSSPASVIVTPSTASQLLFATQPSTNATVGQALVTQPVIRILDQFDNVTTSNATVTLTGLGLSGCSSVTAVNGIATFSSCGFNSANPQVNLTATVGSLSIRSTAIAVSPGAASLLVFTTQPPTSVAANATFSTSPTVSLQDAYGDVITTGSYSISLTGTNLAGCTAAVTMSGGVATFSGCKITATSSGETLTATSTPGGFTAISNQVLVTVAPTKLAITTSPPTTSVAGASLGEIDVSIEDSTGVVVTSSSLSISLNGTGLTGCATTGTVSGVAAFTGCTLNTAGTQVITASSTGLTSATKSVIVSPGVATQLVLVTQPSTTSSSGTALSTQPVLRVEDAFHNAVTTATGSVTALSTPSASLSGYSQALATGTGTATFSGLTITGPASSYTLSFTYLALPAVTSNAISMTSQATKLVVTNSPSATALNGVALTVSPVVTYQNANSTPVNPVSCSVSVAIQSGSPSGELSNTTPTCTNGVATFADLTITGAVGTYTLVFSSTGITSATSTVTLSAGSAFGLLISNTPSTTYTSGVNLTTQPVIKIVDQSSNVVTSATGTVTASIQTGNGTISGASATITSGVATFTALQITGSDASYTLRFSNGSLSTATMTLTPQPAATKLVISTQPSSTVVNGVALAQVPVVLAANVSGVPVSSATGSVSAAVTIGSVVLSRTSATFVNGVATFTALSLTGIVGNYTLTFSSTGLTSVVSTTIALTLGAASKLAITTQPSASATDGLAFSIQPVIAVQDVGGNAVTTSSPTITGTVSTTLGSLAVPSVAAVSGVATFSGEAFTGSTGTYTITFSSPGLASATSNSIVVGIGAPARLILSTPLVATGTSGRVLSTQPVVKIVDIGANVVTTSTASISAAVATGTGTMTGSPVVAVAGVATFSALVLNGVAGNYTITFSSTGLSPVTSTAIAITAAPRLPATITIIFNTSAVLTTTAKAALRTLTAKLDNSGAVTITGFAPRNTTLALLRARAISRYMLSLNSHLLCTNVAKTTGSAQKATVQTTAL